MTRALHEKDVCEVSENDLQGEITMQLHGNVLVLAVEDTRLQSLIPINGQTQLFTDRLDFGPNAEIYIAPLPLPRDGTDENAYFPDQEGDSPDDGQSRLVGNYTESTSTGETGTDTLSERWATGDDQEDEHFPRNTSERFHFETNAYDTLVTVFSKAGYFQRGPPFMDMTRIVREGGTLVAITGLQPESPPDHDAKWWVPSSDDAELEAIRILRSENMKTPILVNVYTVTSSVQREPDATIVTGPEAYQ